MGNSQETNRRIIKEKKRSKKKRSKAKQSKEEQKQKRIIRFLVGSSETQKKCQIIKIEIILNKMIEGSLFQMLCILNYLYT